MKQVDNKTLQRYDQNNMKTLQTIQLRRRGLLF